MRGDDLSALALAIGILAGSANPSSAACREKLTVVLIAGEPIVGMPEAIRISAFEVRIRNEQPVIFGPPVASVLSLDHPRSLPFRAEIDLPAAARCLPILSVRVVGDRRDHLSGQHFADWRPQLTGEAVRVGQANLAVVVYPTKLRF